jgi:ABC-type Fe3+ transport system permease subunit
VANWGELGRELSARARENPLAVAGVALAAGYLLGGGFFSRPTRWIARAAMGAMAVPAVRERVVSAVRGARPAEEAARA